MSQAIVFDSAGTLLKTVREVTEVKTHKLIPQAVETTLLTLENPNRVLVILNFKTSNLLEYDGEATLSSWIQDEHISFGISFGKSDIEPQEIEILLHNDSMALVKDLQAAVKACQNAVEMKEYLFALNGGLIVNTRTKTVEFCIASAGRPFSGVKELIFKLHQKGIATYIASGDREEKLKLVAEKIGIPPENILGIATPEMKAQLVKNLKTKNSTVIMVGDGVNDIEAMCAADIAILTIQQNKNAPELLRKTADFIIDDISDVLTLVCEEGKND